MVLGMILYEGVDLLYNVSKITYETVRGAYFWYYNIDYPEVAREKLAIKDMEKLITRLDELEQYIHITKEYKNTNLMLEN
jgi:hypothetical protein|tara:strand:+ start:560 stop:799 length:240 start_codon:yes stop_codon:yes gene_type:complete